MMVFSQEKENMITEQRTMLIIILEHITAIVFAVLKIKSQTVNKASSLINQVKSKKDWNFLKYLVSLTSTLILL